MFPRCSVEPAARLTPKLPGESPRAARRRRSAIGNSHGWSKSMTTITRARRLRRFRAACQAALLNLNSEVGVAADVGQAYRLPVSGASKPRVLKLLTALFPADPSGGKPPEPAGCNPALHPTLEFGIDMEYKGVRSFGYLRPGARTGADYLDFRKPENRFSIGVYLCPSVV